MYGTIGLVRDRRDLMRAHKLLPTEKRTPPPSATKATTTSPTRPRAVAPLAYSPAIPSFIRPW